MFAAGISAREVASRSEVSTKSARRDWHPDVTEQNRFPAMRLVPAGTGPHWLLGDPDDDVTGEKEYAQLAANGIDSYNGQMRWDPE